jgi:uncharacterized protein YndB with AHSA1/START domain
MDKAVMDKGLVAETSIEIDAPRARVWKALTDPASIKKYMFGADVASDWKVGSPITWKGEWQGRKHERTLQYSHFSPLAGKPDRPENYHTVKVDLSGRGERTKVTLTQDNNSTEEMRDQSQKNWSMMLGSLKKLVEG